MPSPVDNVLDRLLKNSAFAAAGSALNPQPVQAKKNRPALQPVESAGGSLPPPVGTLPETTNLLDHYFSIMKPQGVQPVASDVVTAPQPVENIDLRQPPVVPGVSPNEPLNVSSDVTTPPEVVVNPDVTPLSDIEKMLGTVGIGRGTQAFTQEQEAARKRIVENIPEPVKNALAATNPLIDKVVNTPGSELLGAPSLVTSVGGVLPFLGLAKKGAGKALSKEAQAAEKLAGKAIPPVGEIKPPVVEPPLVKGGAGVPPVKPPEVIAAATAPDPKTIIREYLDNPQRLAEASRQREVVSTQRAIRINEKFAPKLEELIKSGADPEVAIKAASQELSGEMAKLKTPLGDLIPDDMRSALYSTIIEKYGANDYRTLAASKALTNALAGKPIPNIPGAQGGSALKLLQETFADTPEIVDMLKNQDDFLLKLARAKPPQEILNKEIGALPTRPIGKPNLVEPPALEPQYALREKPPTSYGLKEPPIPKSDVDLLKIELAKPPQEVNFHTFPEGTVGKQIAWLPPSGRERAINAFKTAGINALDTINLPRAIIASFDLSAAGRQGLILSLSHPVAAGKTFKSQFKALLSDKNAVALEREIVNRPFTNISIGKGELYIARRGAPLTQREETWASRFAQRIPGVKASERAYITYLNDLRSTVYEQGARTLQKLNATPKDYKELAEFMNWSTGRGTIPKTLQGTASVLNAVLFSPRLLLSRLQLPAKLVSSSAYTRKEAWRALGTFLAFGSSMVALGYLMTGNKPELDPRSSEFGKVRIGDTRLDFWGGYLQYLRFASQILSGQTKTTTGNVRDINRLEVLQRFAQSKGAPGFGLLQDILAGETYMGEEMSTSSESVKQQLYNRLTPLFAQDMIDAINQEGMPGGLVALTSGLGIGVVTYTNPLQKARNDKAQEIYGMSYDDVGKKLNKVAQIAIDRGSPEIQKLQKEQEDSFSRTITGKTDPNNLYYQQVKILENTYTNSIQQAVNEFRATGDGKVFRDKVNDTAKARTSNYDILNNTPSFKEITDKFTQPLTNEQLEKMSPADAARLVYGKLLYSPDMYDQFGNYKFDEVDARRKQFAEQFGQDTLAYVDQYRGVKEEELPVEYQALKADQKVLRPYWDILDKYPEEEQAARKQLYRLGDANADAALNLWGYSSVASTPRSLGILKQKVSSLGLNPTTIEALTPEKSDPGYIWNTALSYIPQYLRVYLWGKGGFDNTNLPNTVDKLLSEKEKDKSLIDKYKEVNPYMRDQYLAQNPDVDVALNIWGALSTVHSSKALTLLKARASELGIPFTALPISPEYKKQEAIRKSQEVQAARTNVPITATPGRTQAAAPQAIDFMGDKLARYGLK